MLQVPPFGCVVGQADRALISRDGLFFPSEPVQQVRTGGFGRLEPAGLLTRLGQPMTVLELSPVVWQVLATAGFAGGFVYWLLAGRNA